MRREKWALIAAGSFLLAASISPIPKIFPISRSVDQNATPTAVPTSETSTPTTTPASAVVFIRK